VWLAIAIAAPVKIAEAVASVVSTPQVVQLALASAFAMTVVVLVPLLLLARWMSAGFAHQGVSRLLVDLEANLASIAAPATLQLALSRSLGDPSLTLAYPSDAGGFVDIHGRPVTLDDSAAGRSVTRVQWRGQLIAVIDHDAALNEQRQVTDAAVAATGLAIENARLYANLQAQLEQLTSSRLQLAQTAFDERLRIQRDLHDGAQQRSATSPTAPRYR
jgi:signal transduction histidine kinase